MKRRAGLICLGIWLVALLASLSGLVPRGVEIAGIGVGLVGIALLWLDRRDRT